MKVLRFFVAAAQESFLDQNHYPQLRSRAFAILCPQLAAIPRRPALSSVRRLIEACIAGFRLPRNSQFTIPKIRPPPLRESDKMSSDGPERVRLRPSGT